jgi:hypothetical protein
MPTRLQNCQTFFKAILVLLLVLSSQLLSQPVAVAVIGDIAEVSPGKIPYPEKTPPVDKDHYLGNSTFQVQLEYPRSFILQETVGDFVFKLITKEPVNRTDIYIPPEFKVSLDKSYVWSSINNSYGKIGISKVPSEDKIAPNWYDVSLTNSGNETQLATRPSSSGHDTKGTIWRGNYTVRLFNVTAPSVVGRYFFKVFTNGTSISVTDYPSVIVSADPNPAYVSGCVKYGGHVDASLSQPYVDPIGSSNIAGASIGLLKGKEGGKVYATGITPDGRIVVGQAFFNSTSSNYTLYGLAPGRYRLNATAAGFAPAELSYEVAIKAGQSLHGVDIFLEHSPSLTVVALSKWMDHPEPWGSVYINAKPKSRNITFEILDYANLTVTLRDKTTVPEEDRCVFYYNGSRDLDGHIPQESAGYVAGIAPGTYYVRAWVNGYIQPSASNERALTRDCMVVFSQNNQSRQIELPLEKTGTLKVTVHFRNSTQVQESATPPGLRSLTVKAYDADDNLRASNSIVVTAGSTNSFLELTGLLNTARDYGLPQGTYTISASFQGYIQPIERGRVRAEHKVTIGDGRSETSFYMLLLGSLNLTIFSVNWQRPFSLVNWSYPNSTVTVEIRDAYGLEVYSTVKGAQPKSSSNLTVPIVTGLDDGTYSIHVFTYGYIQEKSSFFSVRKGEIADISVFMTKGVEIGLTLVFQKQRILDSIDTYKIDWRFNWSRVPVRFEIYDSKAQFVGANTAYVNSSAKVFSSTIAGFKSYYGNEATRWANYYDTTDGVAQKDYGLKPDLYTIKVFVLGYHQQSDPTIDLRTARSAGATLVLQRMGHLSGMIHTFNTMYEKYTRISWVSIDVLGQDTTLRTCTLDGFYELWVNPGSYLMIFSLPGYQTKSLRMQVTEGSDTPRNLELLPFEMSIRSNSQLLVPRSVWRQMGFHLNLLQMTPAKSRLSKE